MQTRERIYLDKMFVCCCKNLCGFLEPQFEVRRQVTFSGVNIQITLLWRRWGDSTCVSPGHSPKRYKKIMHPSVIPKHLIKPEVEIRRCLLTYRQPGIGASRVAGLGRLSAGAKMAMEAFVKRVFTIFATNASFLCIIANLQI